MRKNTRIARLVAAGLLACIAAAAAAFAPLGPPPDLSGHTIDGGGRLSTGGSLALIGSIGQPDAGVMSAGSFVLQGGFLPAGGAGGGSHCPWDCDGSGDGNVNVSDLLALLGQYDPGAPGICDGGESCDFGGNGCVDVSDLLKLLAHYTTDPSGTGCPQ